MVENRVSLLQGLARRMARRLENSKARRRLYSTIRIPSRAGGTAPYRIGGEDRGLYLEDRAAAAAKGGGACLMIY